MLAGLSERLRRRNRGEVVDDDEEQSDIFETDESAEE